MGTLWLEGWGLQNLDLGPETIMVLPSDVERKPCDTSAGGDIAKTDDTCGAASSSAERQRSIGAGDTGALKVKRGGEMMIGRNKRINA